jgi:hypothetical protein
MAFTTFTNGSIADASEINDNFTLVNSVPNVIYTDTGFNSTFTGSATPGAASGAYAILVTGGTINTGVIIEVTARHTSSCNTSSADPASAYANTQLKIETAESGTTPSYTSRYNQTTTTVNGITANVAKVQDSNVGTIKFYYAPTADEKTNGLHIQIVSTSTAVKGDFASLSASAGVTNVQTTYSYY